jgi:hypothetical protein
MRKAIHTFLRFLTVICSIALIMAFYQPWVMGPGGGINAPDLREALHGPHTFLSLFTHDSKVSRNYRLAPWLWAIPASAGVTVVTAAFPLTTALPAIPALLTGLGAAGAAEYFHQEVKAMPLYHEGKGVGLTQRLGFILFGLSVLQMLFRLKGKSVSARTRQKRA